MHPHRVKEEMKDYQATMIASAQENISEAEKPKLLLLLVEVDCNLTNLNLAVYTNDTGLNRLKKKVSDRLDAWCFDEVVRKKIKDVSSTLGTRGDNVLADTTQEVGVNGDVQQGRKAVHGAHVSV